MTEERIEHDSMGDVRIPAEAYWGAQTQRALENFLVSGIVFPFVFIKALVLIKQACAMVNRTYGLLEKTHAHMITRACEEVANGQFIKQFPIDIYQTGSGTSTNMNVNEVIATRANELLTGFRRSDHPIHPNDHVNMGQSSNDVIPSAIHCAVCLQTTALLLPSLDVLEQSLREKQERLAGVVKTGRTHLMDAVPITFGQELSGWASQVWSARIEIARAMERMRSLAIGGTAVGTGINTRADFGALAARTLSDLTGIEFREASNHFEAQASMDAAAAFSGALAIYASALMKIANDLRLMNSGPFSGMREIALPALQPGSSIMPGKVNPVIPESIRMVCAQVLGYHSVIVMANALGEFQLNVMLPVIAYDLLQSITILANASRLLADKVILEFVVDEEHVASALKKNPIVATVLNPVIGYEKASLVVKHALAHNSTVQDAAVGLGYLTAEEAGRLLDPLTMTGPEVRPAPVKKEEKEQGTP